MQKNGGKVFPGKDSRLKHLRFGNRFFSYINRLALLHRKESGFLISIKIQLNHTPFTAHKAASIGLQ